MPTAAVQTQRLTWTLTDVCGSISKGGNGRREREGEKGRRELAAHTHTMQCVLAWRPSSCKPPRGLSFRALTSTFTQNHPCKLRDQAPFPLCMLEEFHFASVRKDTILESDWAAKSQANWNPARISVKIFWLISTHQHPSQSSFSPDTKHWTWSQARLPSREKNS